MPKIKYTKVVAAILRTGENKVLLGQRKAGTHLAGHWEFPGGKIEPDESPAEALKRELKEEIGIDITRSMPLMTVNHPYKEKNIQLQIREVYDWKNEITPCEGQNLAWVSIDKLPQITMPAADKPVLKLLTLEPLYRISPEFNSAQEYLEFIRNSIKMQSKFLQLRAKNLTIQQLQALVIAVNKLKHRKRAIICINSGSGILDLTLANQLDGLHLTSTHLKSLAQRPKTLNGYLFASCHNLEEIHIAEKLGVDMLCLSPLYPTKSHPQAKPLGEDEFSRLVSLTNIPVYALGGIAPKDQGKLRELGASGVAGIRAF